MKKNLLTHLVLFDIDGTLLHPNTAGRASLRAALERVYGTAGDVDTHVLRGGVDRATVAVLMRKAGIPEDELWAKFASVGDVMVEVLRKGAADGTFTLTPYAGTMELLVALEARDDVLLGLITGNFEVSGKEKLRAAGFDPAMFKVGAYGDEAEVRDALPPLAVERARVLTGVTFKGARVVIIGDTPLDITCGRVIGVRSIAVATGWTDREKLASYDPDYLFDDLTDTQAVIEAILAD